MRSAAHYRGREQTYLKHFVLEQYLERVAYNIGSFADEFVYVDGFSGPWRATDEEYEDTSFVIAMNQLRSVRQGLADRGRQLNIRCVFVERNPASFAALQRAVSSIDDIDVQLLQGSFEDRIPDVARLVGSSFALVFIDPTGWSGFALDKIRPLLQTNCEVLVNFMFDDINRHVDDPRESIAATFDALFGGPGFELDPDEDRERQIIEFYVNRLRGAGSFAHTTYTRILKPEHERTYFYLAYGTGHPKGLLEFRRVERKLFPEQARVRHEAKRAARVTKSRQEELFAAGTTEPPSVLETERETAIDAARVSIELAIETRRTVPFDELLLDAIEQPLVWESDVKAILKELRRRGRVRYEGLAPRERVPKFGNGHVVCIKTGV